VRQYEFELSYNLNLFPLIQTLWTKPRATANIAACKVLYTNQRPSVSRKKLTTLLKNTSMKRSTWWFFATKKKNSASNSEKRGRLSWLSDPPLPRCRKTSTKSSSLRTDANRHWPSSTHSSPRTRLWGRTSIRGVSSCATRRAWTRTTARRSISKLVSSRSWMETLIMGSVSARTQMIKFWS